MPPTRPHITEQTRSALVSTNLDSLLETIAKVGKQWLSSSEHDPEYVRLQEWVKAARDFVLVEVSKLGLPALDPNDGFIFAREEMDDLAKYFRSLKDQAGPKRQKYSLPSWLPFIDASGAELDGMRSYSSIVITVYLYQLSHLLLRPLLSQIYSANNEGYMNEYARLMRTSDLAPYIFKMSQAIKRRWQPLSLSQQRQLQGEVLQLLHYLDQHTPTVHHFIKIIGGNENYAANLLAGLESRWEDARPTPCLPLLGLLLHKYTLQLSPESQASFASHSLSHNSRSFLSLRKRALYE